MGGVAWGVTVRNKSDVVTPDYWDVGVFAGALEADVYLLHWCISTEKLLLCFS